MKRAILAGGLLAAVLTGSAFAQSGPAIKLADVAKLSGGGATDA
jgi:branched-chain amino acid transport system substrate-binding protein